MRTLRILDLIITILFYSMLGIGILTFGIYALSLFGIDLGIKTSTTLSNQSNTSINLLFSVTLIIYSSYIYSIFLFKQNISSFVKFQIFTNRVIKNFKIMGIIYIVGNIISSILIPSIKQHIKIDLGYENDILNSPLNSLVIGLFFLVLSNVFQIAQKQKEENIELKKENELTI